MVPVHTDRGAELGVLHPVSAGQHALWMLHRLAPGSAAYNDAGAARFVPPPNIPALTAAVDIVTQRHDLLRSRFVDDDGLPARVVDPQGPGLVVVDIGHLDDRAMSAVVSAAADEPYDLAGGGTARFRVFRRPEVDAVLLCGNHHIASDAASQFVLWRDLLTAYDALTRGQIPDLPPLGWTWNDQVAAEQRNLAGPLRTSWTQYWRTSCRDVPAADLPLDRARPVRPGYRGNTVTAKVPTTLAIEVRNRAMALGVTPFAIHLATLQAVVHRIGGHRRFLLGCPISRRRSRAMVQSVGYYVTSVLLRADVHADSTFGGLAEAAARELRQASAAAGLPYPDIVRAIGHDARTGPAYRIAITQVDARTSFDRSGSDGTIEPFPVPRLQGQCDLNVEITRSEAGTEIVFRYDRDLFEERTMDRHLGTYLHFLDAATADPTTAIAQVAPTGSGRAGTSIARI